MRPSRERRLEHEQQRCHADENNTEQNNTRAVVKTGADLLAAAREAIDRALSGDAETFLRDARQEGGE